jgi:type II secretory pathway pseudopilin PulG
MQFSPSSRTRTVNSRERAQTGFTLAEVLAALLFMAIVIPVAMQGLHIATRAGVVAVRKMDAARIADRLLTESIIMTNWVQSFQSGVVEENGRTYPWNIRSELWIQMQTNQPVDLAAGGVIAGSQPLVNPSIANQIMMNLLTVEVNYFVQEEKYTVRLSTLVNPETAL